MKQLLAITTLIAVLATPGCVRVKTDPVRVEPIQITVDVNIKVEKELQDFFGALDEKSATMKINEPAPGSEQK